jgi:hypothetical protein
MKKFIVFVFFLLLLIVSEYFLLSELFSQKRFLILGLCLLGTVVSVVAVIRFYKKYILPAKHP